MEFLKIFPTHLGFLVLFWMDKKWKREAECHPNWTVKRPIKYSVFLQLMALNRDLKKENSSRLWGSHLGYLWWHQIGVVWRSRAAIMHSRSLCRIRGEKLRQGRKKFSISTPFSEYKFSSTCFSLHKSEGIYLLRGVEFHFVTIKYPFFSRSEMEPLLRDRSNIRSSQIWETDIYLHGGTGFCTKKSEGQNGTKEMKKRRREKSQMVRFKNLMIKALRLDFTATTIEKIDWKNSAI